MKASVHSVSQETTDLVTLVCDDSSTTVHITGKTAHVQQLFDNISDITEKLQEDLELSKSIVTETIKTLKHDQILMLVTLVFLDEMQNKYI